MLLDTSAIGDQDLLHVICMSTQGAISRKVGSYDSQL